MMHSGLVIIMILYSFTLKIKKNGILIYCLGLMK